MPNISSLQNDGFYGIRNKDLIKDNPVQDLYDIDVDVQLQNSSFPQELTRRTGVHCIATQSCPSRCGSCQTCQAVSCGCQR
ncbi:MAG: hypothetical protein H0W88_01410 [Parachlamydiaceae bacterium]|nr:hypothetical protein [Parachlamydiaceae bacterium]